MGGEDEVGELRLDGVQGRCTEQVRVKSLPWRLGTSDRDDENDEEDQIFRGIDRRKLSHCEGESGNPSVGEQQIG